MRRQNDPLRLYLSYPMTLATAADQAMIERVRQCLRRYPDLVSFYDPDNDEDKNKPLWAIQDDDFSQLGAATALLAIVCPGTSNSKGQCAEIEWAVRSFDRPVVVFNPSEIVLPPWVDATLQNGRALWYFDFGSLLTGLRIVQTLCQ